MNTSYKRYYETNLPQTLGISLFVGSLATALTYPLEFVKTRIQLRSELIGMRGHTSLYWGYNPFKEMRNIHGTGLGCKQFFQGLDSALAARLTHLFVRNLIYKVLYDKNKPKKAHNDLTIREKSVLAGMAGMVAAVVSNPMEVAMVRQIARGTLPKHLRPTSTSMLSTLQQAVTQQGVFSLFTNGLTPHLLKALMLNVTLTGPYDFFNERLWITFGDVHTNRPIALLGAAGVATVATLPFDNLKTKLQKQLATPELNRINYKSFGHAVETAIMVEGPLTFFSGASTYYTKVLVYSLFTVYATDLFTNTMKRNAGLKEWQI